MIPILVCGLAVTDFVFDVEEFPDLPQKYAARNARVALGGCAGVAAAAIARLGGTTQLATPRRR